jgi:hypothetical protein
MCVGAIKGDFMLSRATTKKDRCGYILKDAEKDEEE